MEYIQLALLLVVIYLLIAKNRKNYRKLVLFAIKAQNNCWQLRLIDGRIIE